MEGCVMSITSVGLRSQKLLLFVFESHRLLLMIKRILSLLLTMFLMGLIVALLAL